MGVAHTWGLGLRIRGRVDGLACRVFLLPSPIDFYGGSVSGST